MTTQARLIAGRSVELKALPEGDAGNPAIALAETAIEAANAFEARRKAIADDPNLSEVGKLAQLTPALKEVVCRVAGAAGQVAADAAAIDAREAALLAVPQLHDTAHGAAAVDVEIRQWWRALDADERARMLQAFNDGPEHKRIELALLRSPIALADIELRSVREGWNRQARLDNPAEALAISSARRAQTWAREALAHVGGIVGTLPGVMREEVARSLTGQASIVTDGGWVFSAAPKERAQN